MTEPERTPRRIERTLKPGETWTLRGVDVIAITVKARDANAGETRIVATVLDRESK
jgi:hypothetical protein